MFWSSDVENSFAQCSPSLTVEKVWSVWKATFHSAEIRSSGPTLSNRHLRFQSASPSVDLMQFYILTQTLCWVDTGQWMRMRVFASTSFSNSSHQDHFTGLASAKESDFYNSTNTETNIRLSQSCLWHADLKVQIKALSVWVITILRLVDECIVVKKYTLDCCCPHAPCHLLSTFFLRSRGGRLRFFQKYFFIFPTNCLLWLSPSKQATLLW